MAEEKALIPFKSFNISLMSKRIDKALEKTRDHYSTAPTGEQFETFVLDLYKAFPQTIRYDVFFASVIDLVGQTLTREVIKAAAWRLAGNVNKLRRGIPCPPFTRQTVLEWCPVTIVRGNPGRGYDKKFGYYYDYRIMAGQAAGLRFATFWSMKYARFVARSIGFRRTRKAHYKLQDGVELVQMQLYLLFDPKLSKEDRPTAYHFYVPASVRTKNQKILKQRYRIIPCPLEYTRIELACQNCPMGYDKCPAGCHPQTYTEKPCPRCNKPETFFDPLGRGVVCVECEDQERRHHAD